MACPFPPHGRLCRYTCQLAHHAGQSYNKYEPSLKVRVVFRKVELSLIIGLLACSLSVFAQAPQQRITQTIIINGQQAQGVLVVENGTIQSQTCPAPQPYVAADQSSTGWACFEPSTGMWLLHAQPPQQTAAPQQGPVIIYSQPAPIYVPAPAYGYYSFGYPYGYRYGFGPTFGFGFGFGPIIVNRPFVSRPVIIGRLFAGRPFVGGFRGGRFGRR